MAGIIGIEHVYFAKDVSSTLSTAEAIRTVELIVRQVSKPCVYIRSNTVEAAVVGAEKGDKA